MDELSGKLYCSGEAVDYFHGVEAHIHGDEDGEVLGDLGRGHEFEEYFDGNDGVVLHKVGELLRCQPAVIHELWITI